MAFTVRDPSDPAASMPWQAVPSPAPLWVQLMFREPTQSEYLLRWIDTRGHAYEATVIPAGPAQAFLLKGIEAAEDSSGLYITVVPAVLKLTLTCRDRETGSSWQATRSWSHQSGLGSYELTFESTT